jgi:hypothetical protein
MVRNKDFMPVPVPHWLQNCYMSLKSTKKGFQELGAGKRCQLS